VSLQVTNYEGKRFLVSPEQRWLSALYRRLQEREIPVGEAVLADRELRLQVSRGDDESLTLVVAPGGKGRPAWKKAGHFAVSYEGPNEIPVGWEPMLGRFVKTLDRFVPHIPRRLTGFASLAIEDGPPEEVIAKLFPFTTLERSHFEGEELVTVLLRTISACNQSCPFCSAPIHNTPPLELVRVCLEAVAELLPGAAVSITGGEPTLKNSFLDELETALALDGIGQVQVQTNAVSFASRIDPAAIETNPKLGFFVSLHGADDAIYDQCTGTTGQMADGMKGLKRLLEAGHRVRVNTVISRLNLHNLEKIVAHLESLGDGYDLSWEFSTLICPEHFPKAADLLVSYTDVLGVLKPLLADASSRGLDVASLLSSTHASMPVCLGRDTGTNHVVSVLDERETGIEDLSRPYVKAASCRTCSANGYCLGVPALYAERFGLSELQPFQGTS